MRFPQAHRARALALASLFAVTLGGCDFQPFEPLELHYSLSENPIRNSVERLEELDADLGAGAGEAAGAQVLGALESLFGTPRAPRYTVTDQLLDLDLDPNFAGDTELDDGAYEAVLNDNRTRRFERQLALIEAGRWEDVPEPRGAADLWRRWTEDFLPALREDPDAINDYYELPWREAAAVLFEEHYPTLRESAELYRIECLHCHGVEGGGNGPTSPFLDPPPRDYRQGVFKWVSVERNKRPRRADLRHILEQGVNFTAMPSFARFSRGEIEGLVDYVRLLSMRGEVEWLLVMESLDSDSGTLPPEVVGETYDGVWGDWLAAENTYVWFDGEVPEPGEITPERITHGKQLFRGNVANCYTCHGVFGRGGGESIYETPAVVDADGNPVMEEVPVTFSTLEALPDHDYVAVLSEPDAPGAPLRIAFTHAERRYQKTLDASELDALLHGEAIAIGPGKVRLENGWKLHLLNEVGEPVTERRPKFDKVVKLDEWGNPSNPRNFQVGVFRGGSRPIDLWRKIKHGIGGTIMPAAEEGLSDDDLWDIVYFVYSITERFDLARIQEAREAEADDDHGHGDDHGDDHEHADDGGHDGDH